MITKDCFCSIIDASMDYYDELGKLFNLLNMQPENFLLHYLDRVLDSLVNELEDTVTIDEVFLDPIIFDYVFNHNWGRLYKEDSFMLKIDDICYAPKNSKELYDLLILLYNKEKKQDN